MTPLRQRVLHWLIALVVVHKVAYFFEYAALPFLYGPVFDSAVYDAQAAAIRDGRFGDATLLAFSPLYGYFLALFPNGEFVLVAVAQLALGALNIFLVHRIALRAFGSREALAAAGLYFGYAMFAFYETKVLSETLGLSLALGSMLLFFSRETSEEAKPKSSIASGALLALAVLARASLLFAGLLSVVLAFLPWSKEVQGFRMPARRGAFFAIGFGVVLLANGLWNYAHTGFFVPVIFVSRTAAAAASVGDRWAGNLGQLSTHANGEVSPWDVVDQARERMLHRDQQSESAPPIDILGVLRSAPGKIASTLSDQETSYDYGFYGERTEVKALYLLPLSFACLVLFAIVGGFFLAHERGPRAIFPYLGLILGTLATTVLFHPSSRYRLPMALPLVLLGGYGLIRAFSIEKMRIRKIVGGSLIFASLLLIARHEMHSLQSPAWWQLRVAEGAAAAGDLMTLEDRIRRARALAPHDVRVEQRIRQISGRSH